MLRQISEFKFSLTFDKENKISRQTYAIFPHQLCLFFFSARVGITYTGFIPSRQSVDTDSPSQSR